MQELEIEKRFLVPQDKLEELKSLVVPGSKTVMNDVYVPNGDAHKDLRLRQQNDKYMATRKRPVKDGETFKAKFNKRIRNLACVFYLKLFLSNW